jgi:hypothetical protein
MTQLMTRPGALSDDSEDALDSALPDEKLCDYANTVFFGTNLLLPGNKREHLVFLNDEYSKVISSQAAAAHEKGGHKRHCSTWSGTRLKLFGCILISSRLIQVRSR